MNIPAQPDQNIIDWITEIRRHIHRNPELGFQEEKTAAFISAKLTELNISYRAGVGGTGIIADIQTDSNLPRVALRADMDALPLLEKTGLPFASQNPGVMHACGHDGHIAVILGAAALLKKKKLNGNIRLIFQPAEEGGGGAQSMIAHGAIDSVNAIIGGHIDRHFAVGEIAVQPGLICAYTDEFQIDLHGKGGHAARPHETIDSIVVASLLVMSIQTLVSREVNPAYPSVVTVGQITGGSAANVIADSATLKGTIRTTHKNVRKSIMAGLKRMVSAMEYLYNAQTSIEFMPGFPPIINDTKIAAQLRKVAIRLLGEERVVKQPHPSMGGEDFSFYLKEIPGCFVRYGALRQDLPNTPAHSPRFDFDEKALPVAAHFMATAAAELLVNLNKN